MSHDALSDYKCHDVQELKRQPDNASALSMLQRVAAQVQPILRKRKWTVPKLREFMPSNPNLLGINIGGGGGRTLEIRLRLRYHNNPRSFYPYEDVLGTMLHEITHNVQGKHDAKFYKILDELREECEGLMAKGISGTGIGFDGPSMGRLGAHGGTHMHNPPEAMQKALAARAAAKRAAQQRLMHSGPRRLGGDQMYFRGMTPQQASAAAAQRRLRDNIWCPAERGVTSTTLAEGVEDSDVKIVGVADAAASSAASVAQRQPIARLARGVQGRPGAKGASAVKSDVAIAVSQVSRPGATMRSTSTCIDLTEPCAASPASTTGTRSPLAPQPLVEIASSASNLPSCEKNRKEKSRPEACEVAEAKRCTINDAEFLYHAAKRKRHSKQPLSLFDRSDTAEQPLRIKSNASGWTCACCTFRNDAMKLQCEACLHVRPMGNTPV